MNSGIGKLLCSLPFIFLGSNAYSQLGFDSALSSAVRMELAQVRQATARYHDLSEALADGYIDIDLFVPGQGFHFLKPDLLDGLFELDRPEVLVYALNAQENRLRLVAVEYLIISPDAPEGFTGDADQWVFLEDFNFWALHAWVWLANPNGIFAEFNPRVP